MKHFLKTLLVLGVLAAVGCTQASIDLVPQEDGTIVLLVDSEDFRTEGELRYGVDCEDSANINDGSMPYIVIPYNYSTAPTIYVSDINPKGGVYVEGAYVPMVTNDEIYELNIPIKGIPTVTGDLEINFTVTVGEQVTNLSSSMFVLGSEEGTNKLVIDSLVVYADIARGAKVQPINEDGDQYIAVYYSEGWGRDVKFAIDEEETETRAFQLADTVVTLSGGSYSKYTVIPISGYFRETDETIDLPIRAVVQNDSYSHGDATLTQEDIATSQIEALQATLSYSGVMQQGKYLISDSTLVVNYTQGCYRKDVTLKLEIGSDMGVAFYDKDYYATNKKYPTELEVKLEDLDDEGSLEYTLTGMPDSANNDYDVTISATFSGYGVSDVTGLTDTEVKLSTKTDVTIPVPTPTITSIGFTGPIINYGQDNTNFVLTVTYTNDEPGAERKALRLDNLSGYLVPNSDRLARLGTQTLQTGGPYTITFNLGSDFFDSTESLSDVANPPSRFDIDAWFSYDNIAMDEAVTKTITNATGFVWDGLAYNTLTVGGVKWLDRNVGATSIEVDTPILDVETYVVDDSWSPNFDTNGDYFYRGISTGIPIKTSGFNAENVNDNNAPWFWRSARSNQTWAMGYYESPDTDYYPTTISEDNEAMIDSYWSVAALGDINNPCPNGYRVPTLAEAYQMVYDISGTSDGDGVSTVANSSIVPAMMNDMNFTFSGYLNYNGPYIEGVTVTGYGTVGIVGFYAVESALTVAQYSGDKVPASEGTICLATCDYSTVESATSLSAWYKVVQVSGTGVLSTLSLNRGCCVPVRCVQY